MGKLVFGWDVSTSIIGLCIMDLETGTARRYGALRIMGETMMEKYRHGCDVTAKIAMEFLGNEQHHFVEDRLGNFTKGATMQQTLMKLAQMNAVISYHLDSFGTVTHIHPSTAKRIAGLKVPKGADKKLEAIKLVRASDVSFPFTQTKAGNPGVGIADMADAWLLATAGRKLLRGEATLGEGKKAGGGHIEAGSSAP